MKYLQKKAQRTLLKAFILKLPSSVNLRQLRPEANLLGDSASNRLFFGSLTKLFRKDTKNTNH
jgi:hypothetical protein